MNKIHLHDLEGCGNMKMSEWSKRVIEHAYDGAYTDGQIELIKAFDDYVRYLDWCKERELIPLTPTELTRIVSYANAVFRGDA